MCCRLWSGKVSPASLPLSVFLIWLVTSADWLPWCWDGYFPFVISKASASWGRAARCDSYVTISYLCKSFPSIVAYGLVFIYFVHHGKTYCTRIDSVCRCLFVWLICWRVGRWRWSRRRARLYSQYIWVVLRLLSNRDRSRFGWRNHV